MKKLLQITIASALAALLIVIFASHAGPVQPLGVGLGITWSGDFAGNGSAGSPVELSTDVTMPGKASIAGVSGSPSLTVASTDANGITVTRTASAATNADSGAVYSTETGTYNTTSQSLFSYGLRGASLGSRSAGANTLNNYGVFGFAKNGQTNVGVIGQAVNSSIGVATDDIGVLGVSDGIGTNAYALRGVARGGANTNYGVYGTSSGASTNYSGYFDAGAFRVNGLSTFNDDATFESGTCVINSAGITCGGTLLSGTISGVTAGDGLTGGGSSGAVTLDVGCGAGLSCQSDDVSLIDCIDGDTLIWAPEGEGASTWQCAHSVTAGYRLDRYVTATTNGGLAVTMDDTDTTARKAFVNLRADCSDGQVLASGSSGATWSCTSVSSSGSYIGRQIFTGSGTYTPTSGTKTVVVRMVGGGGGGGGVSATASQSAAAAGGNSGHYFEQRFSPGAAVTGGAVTIGALGAGGSAGNNAGSAGGDTSVVIQGSTYTAKGGTQGNGMAAAASFASAAPFTPAAVSSSGDVNVSGPGGVGVVIGASAGVGASGAGGSTPLGAGGRSVRCASEQAGPAGTGYGGGGAGASSSGGSNRAGGDGAAGVVIIDEYN